MTSSEQSRPAAMATPDEPRPELAPAVGAATDDGTDVAADDATGGATHSGARHDATTDAAATDIAPAAEAGLDRIFTVPNMVTMVRLLCIPLFLWLLFGAHRQSAAAVLLAVLGATDWVDGFIARRYHQVSTLGKVLDPTADRLLVGTGVIAIMVYGAVPLWFGIATLAREVLVGATVVVLAALGARRIDVLWVGKAGTFGLMFAYPAFLLGYGTAGWQAVVRDIAWVTGIVGLVLAWVAAASYLGPARAALAEGRAGRSGGDEQEVER